MAELNIKQEFKDVKVAFKGSRGRTLGELEQSDLEVLAESAHANRKIKQYFDGDIPTLEELRARKVEKKAPAKAIPAQPAQPSANSTKTEPAK